MQNDNANPESFLLPDLGEGLEEATLIEWCVSVGHAVSELEVLAKMETAKAVVDVTSPRAGVIEMLHGKPGDVVKVGSPLVSFVSTQPAPALPEADEQKRRDRARADEESAQASEAPREIDAGTVVGALDSAPPPPAGDKAPASPAVRRLARDLGVDMAKVVGTGIGGRITSRDVQAAAADVPPMVTPEPPAPPVRPALPLEKDAKAAKGALWPSTYEGTLPPRRIPTLQRKQTPPIAPGQESLRIPFRGVRRIIAKHLRYSIGHAVHFTIMDDADITALDEQRRRFTEFAREKVTLLPLIAAAVCRVLSGREEPKFNRLNSTVDDENQEIVQHRTVHLGIATDTDEGLMVPVIKDAERLGVLEMGRKIQELAKKARERDIKREELVGSTFTISNFGSLHGRYGTPIINYPEACILAVGRAREGVVVREHMIGVGLLLPLSLSADHRVVDGGTAAQALARIVELLQNPEELLLPHR